jgi:two-component system, OmpR family, sensor histidine kinase CreC
MRFSLRIFLSYFLLIALLAAYVLNLVREEIKPAMRQSAEEVLLDTANLLSVMIQPDFIAGRLDEGRFAKALTQFSALQPNAKITDITHERTYLRVYVTNERGIVVLDSDQKEVGQDYSRWRDVSRTLRGEYGARTTLSDPNNPLSTVMYVAAPIKNGNQIVGVLTVSRPNLAMQPYITRSENKLLRTMIVVILAGLVAGALFSWGLSRGITRLTNFARNVSAGKAIPVPRFFANWELTSLAEALGAMRDELDGKAYIENYAHELTHELKSPLAAIRASAEILQDDLSKADRQRFLQHVDAEVSRMQRIVDYLLQLASVEARHELHDAKEFSLRTLMEEQIRALASQLEQRKMTFITSPNLIRDTVYGESFLLGQALRNVLQNALDFTDSNGKIAILLEQSGTALKLTIHNDGAAIPEYALDKVFDRFYSLPRPHGQKSTGLGLVLTRTIVELHGGKITLANAVERGVEVVITLPQQ